MAAKLIVFEEDARRALERGMDQLANAVRITLGPISGSTLWPACKSPG